MRCRACNKVFEPPEDRVVEIEEGKTIVVEEDLCEVCRYKTDEYIDYVEIVT